MGHLDISDLDSASQAKKADPGSYTEIEGTYRDLSEEQPFPEDKARDRGPSALQSFISRIPYGPLRTLNPKHLDTKWQLFEQLTKTLPLNEMNLPNFIYRPDMLDHRAIQAALLAIQNPIPIAPPLSLDQDSDESLDTGSTTTPSIRVSPETPVDGTEISARSASDPHLEEIQSQLDAATLQLTYQEGFPALEDGTPFWRKLTTEDSEAFDAFVHYLELGGARKRTDLIGYPQEAITEWFHLNFWTYRVKAFELYRVVDAQKTRLLRMLKTEDSHFVMAERLFKKIDTITDGADFEEALAKLEPEKLINILDKIVKIQRISVGLAANGGAIEAEDLRRAPTTNVLVQQIVDKSGETIKINEDTPDLLLDAPDAIEQAQDLIIKTQQQRPID